MEILLHDYGAYPFVVQLARSLAGRGHAVRYLYNASINRPVGAVQKTDVDAEWLEIKGLRLNSTVQRYSFIKRWRQECAFGVKLAGEIQKQHPEVVLSTNAPLDVQKPALMTCKRLGIPFVFWLQDALGLAAHKLLCRKLPLAGDLVGRYYIWLERRLLRQSDRVVLITADFLPLMRGWGVDLGKTCVLPNWAPLEETPVRPKSNAWARSRGLDHRFVFLYSGNLGMKHNPSLLLRLALHFQTDPQVVVLVVSEGIGADWLRLQIVNRQIDNIIVLDYQPYEVLPDVLGSADVLVSILEPEAGLFSVPSKVLTYLCARRSLLLAVPPENSAARIVKDAHAGLVAAPNDFAGFIHAADRLRASPELRENCARNALDYALKHFQITGIARQFEAILSSPPINSGWEN